ncbi:hypothetical protein SASPL_101737 [Salvia splendens]|uniref:NB-ARC domain-containing protein n=1 Tax=Salvia splendens TaxID=180675 RepID=A0A8X8YVE5_SALSN|nr:hypothetical protein SASPL_101737 [Salvia splendens]
MAAYAALVSLAQTTTFDTNHAISDFSINAKENIRSIHEYVITLLTFLEDYPERTNRWEAKLRDIAHKIEDAIEQFMYYGGKETSSSFTFEKELKDVTLNLCLFAGDVMDERPSYSSLSSSSSSVAASRVPPTENGAAVGLDEDVMTIKDLLCGRPSSKLQVIPILGMGGIGKTTLARTVYDDPLITDYFDIRVWLTISQDYNARKVLLSLVDSIKMMDEHMPRLEMDDVSILMEKACNKSMEEDAEDYLEDVVKRNLVIVTSRKSGGKIKSCSLHDMVRELCIRKAHDERFLHVIDGLVYETDKRCNLYLLENLHHLQKLELYGQGGFPWMRDNLFTLPKTLKKLTLYGGKFLWQDMSIIGSLPNLQELKLKYQTSGGTWEIADEEFSELRYLLIKHSGLQHWKTESSHFPSLKRLMLRYCRDLMEIPQDIGNISTLELIQVDPDNNSLVESAKKVAEDQQSYGNDDLHVRVSYY